MKKVTVFGSGNGGMTAAYHFAKCGWDVCLCDFEEFPVQIEAVHRQGGIFALAEDHGCSMLLPGFQKIGCSTHDIETAMDYSDLYVIVCPSFAQEKFFEKMIPYLKPESIIVTMPANYASLVFSKMMKEAGREKIGVHFVDTISIPWACRLKEPGKIMIMGLKWFMPLCIFPKEKSERTERIIRELMPVPVELLENPLIAGLENINFGGHPLMTVVNIGLLENFSGQFNYYRDCCSTATAKAASKMDRERLAVGNAFGFRLRSELDAMNALYDMHENSVYDFNRKSVSHGKVGSAPINSRARYITEDVPYLLVPCSQLGQLAGIQTPVVDACITLANAYNDEDYRVTGRTLAKMGLDGLTCDEMRKMFSN